jgi:hypothetical protein
MRVCLQRDARNQALPSTSCEPNIIIVDLVVA